MRHPRGRRVRRLPWVALAVVVLLAIDLGAGAQPGHADEPAAAPTDLLQAIPGGHFVMGDAAGEANEAPSDVQVAPFRIMRLEVTNQQWAAFIAESGHVTDPEKAGFGWVWDGQWRRVQRATWQRPAGGEDARPLEPDHPVVQVSAEDAAAFCAFYGLRLPSEAEWEFAARGTDDRRYPWGSEPPRQSAPFRANFGTIGCCAPDASDGFLHTAPVGSFPAGRSPFGLDDMAGNVWEWTSSPFPGRPDQVALRGGGWGNNPYCLRAAYRHNNPPDIGLNMVGFRCAADAAK